MQKRFKFFAGLLAFVLALTTFVTTTQAAANASLGLSADVTSATVNQQVKVSVSAAINEFSATAVRVKLKYNPSLLEYVSTSNAGSQFPNELGSTTVDSGAGMISTSRGTLSDGVTGSAKVVEVTFKVRESGSTTITFDSSSKIWDGNGDEQPLDTGASLALSFATASSSNNTQTTATPTATPTSAPAATSTPKPATATPTPKSSAKLAVTPKSTTQTSSTPTAASTATPSATATLDPNAISPTQSTVTLSNLTAIADGIDTITLTVVVRKNDSSVVTDVTPTLSGARIDSDTVSDFVYDSETQSWSTQIVSTQPGTVTISVLASEVSLSTQDLTFTDANAAATTGDDGSSFGRTVIIGLIILLLLLLLLFFLWKKLRERHEDDEYNNEGEDGAFPGEGDSPSGDLPPAPATPIAASKAETANEAAEPVDVPKDEIASFDPNHALQRATPPPPPDDNPPADGTVQL